MFAGCGTQSASSAMSSWASTSNYSANMSRLTHDAHKVARLLRGASSAGERHLLCGILLVDTQAANSSLPTPDDQVTKLLGRAYDNLGAGANLCYKLQTGDDITTTLSYLESGTALVAQASARVASLI
jgi:hypothetical protein